MSLIKDLELKVEETALPPVIAEYDEATELVTITAHTSLVDVSHSSSEYVYIGYDPVHRYNVRPRATTISISFSKETHPGAEHYFYLHVKPKPVVVEPMTLSQKVGLRRPK